MNTIFSFILVLGLLIFVHELGHFIFAKLFGVRVLKFSLGFGPAIAGRKVGDTEYVISAFPLGGFVKMFGENPDEQNVPPEDKKVSFAHKPVWQRFCIVLAGPLFNLFFCLFLFFMIFFFVGVPTPVDNTRIGKVYEGSAAEAGGVRKGDIILQIGEKKTYNWNDVLEEVKSSGGEEISFIVKRENDTLNLRITPVIDSVKNIFGEEIDKRYMIGVMKADDFTYEKNGVVDSFTSASKQTWLYIALTVKGFIKIIQQVVPASELGGPILIAKIAGEQMKAGWINFINFMALLSVNLGILNLLPIPVLDGGHLVFLTIEGIRRKPMDEKAQIFAQQIGIGLLGTLMIFVFYNDIVKLFQ